MNKPNRFAQVLNAAREREPEEPVIAEESPEVQGSEVPAPATPPGRTGRPRGKRSSVDYEQITAYIRKDTHRAVKRALLDDTEDRDFSELIEVLLSEWLKVQKSG